MDEGQKLAERQTWEQQYFESLELLQTEYPLQPMEVSNRPYPYNVLLSAWDVERKMSRIAPDNGFHIVDGRFLIDCGKRMNTHQRLYYIPVQPLFMLTKEKGRQAAKTAQLLLSVFAYLYDIAGIPYYTTYSFIGCQYEMIEEWIMGDYEGEEEEPQDVTELNEVREACSYGKIMEKMLHEKSHLITYGKRLKFYKPANNWEEEILIMATAFYELWQCYPDTNIFSHIIPLECGDDDEQVTRIEQYISFVATGEGALFNELFQMVNERLGESVDMDEPAAFTIYGLNRQISVQSFDYEQRLLPLLEDLIYLLNNRP